MAKFIRRERRGTAAVITLDRQDLLNAWDAAMRDELVEALEHADRDAAVRAIVLTGAGERAFSAGQDLNETMSFDPDRAEQWVREWERLYGVIRGLSKPLIAALNGVAAGSAFQVALLCDFRIGHPGVRMGQPEINSGIASTTGPWIMREILGLARTIELTLTGNLLGAEECARLGILNKVVPRERVLSEALTLAEELAAKPPVAMRLNKQRFREMTEAGFQDCLAAGIRIQRESYATGEPGRMMEQFLAKGSAGKRA
ncbi:MAG TPA: enoyl-CoA hydratase/isomerase family protein [Alphaproteobacteria bacterium]|nr:enoyl-CoA hydratase/isomerase family protein [Alphaproteobacteria bacterium]